MNPAQDQTLATDIAQADAAREADKKTSWFENARQKVGAEAAKVSDPVGHWMTELPKNVGVGMIDAAVNTADTMKWLSGFYDPFKQPEGDVKPKEPSTGTDVVDQHHQEMAANERNGVYDLVKGDVSKFRDELASGSSTSDQVTQSIAQYAIPFMGYAKLLGGVKGASLLQKLGTGAGAEALTASTVLDPHDARFADIMKLGKHTEGKFADAMNTIAPDGSLMNQYINYMTNRDNEGEAEGRFKNVVDNLGVSAAAAGLLKSTATTLRGGRAWAESLANNVVKDAGTIGPSKELGQVAFHGSPHDFNAFDASKIGAGEGHQSFGHGLYFAENPVTAGTYEAKLSQSKAPPGSAIRTAQEQMFATGNDAKRAYAALQKRAEGAQDAELRDRLKSAAEIVKAGNAERGAGRMYTVDIPDEKVGKMLLWDKPLSEQPEVAKLIGGSKNPNATGRYVYEKLSETFGSDKEASKYLAERGVPGIKYLDQGSREAGKGTHNIVLFDPNDAKIVKKQGAGGKDIPIEKAQSSSRTANAKAAESIAPKTGVHVMQTADKEWTLFVNGKASHVYDKASSAMEDLKALEK